MVSVVEARGIVLDLGSNLSMSPALAGRFLSPGPPGKSPFLSKQFPGSEDSHVVSPPSIFGTAFLFQTEALDPLDPRLFPRLPAALLCPFSLALAPGGRVSGVAAPARRRQPVPAPLTSPCLVRPDGVPRCVHTASCLAATLMDTWLLPPPGSREQCCCEHDVQLTLQSLLLRL